jgi:hypothetical protein
MEKFEIIFDNGGGTTLQCAKFTHCYDNPEQAAVDVRALLDGESTDGWDGNNEEDRMEYDHDTVRNGGYRWMDQDEVKSIIAAGSLADNWGNMSDFFIALGVKVDKDD